MATRPNVLLVMTDQQLWERARRGEVVAYRARVADHWEWRLSPADGIVSAAATSPTTAWPPVVSAD